MIETQSEISILQAAELLGVSYSTIYVYMQKGMLTSLPSESRRNGRRKKSMLSRIEVLQLKHEHPNMKWHADCIKNSSKSKKYESNTLIVSNKSYYKDCPICGCPTYYKREMCIACEKKSPIRKGETR